MDRIASVPRAAFMIHLGSAQPTEASLARLRHLVHVFGGHRVPATWIVDGARRANLLSAQPLSAARDDLALVVDRPWCTPELSQPQFRGELESRCAALAGNAGAIRLVVGDPELLRPRAAVLARQGVLGILSATSGCSSAAKPRPFPCGLWQLEANLCWPPQRWFPRWFGARCLTVRQLTALGTAWETTLVTIDSAELQRIGPRGLQSLEKLLRRVSWAESRGQLVVDTIQEVVREMAQRRAVKPQRSILQSAA